MKTPTRTVGPGQQVVDVHHRTEIVTALRQAARLADDTAKFDEAGATAAWPEYEVMRTGSADAAKHTRLLELYPHVIGARNDAAKNRAAAALYREAADLIENHENSPWPGWNREAIRDHLTEYLKNRSELLPNFISHDELWEIFKASRTPDLLRAFRGVLEEMRWVPTTRRKPYSDKILHGWSHKS